MLGIFVCHFTHLAPSVGLIWAEWQSNKIRSKETNRRYQVYGEEERCLDKDWRNPLVEQVERLDEHYCGIQFPIIYANDDIKSTG